MRPVRSDARAGATSPLSWRQAPRRERPGGWLGEGAPPGQEAWGEGLARRVALSGASRAGLNGVARGGATSSITREPDHLLYITCR